MKKLILLFCLFASQFSFAQNAGQRIDSMLQTIYKPGEPGIAIAIEMNGKVFFKNAYGLADLEGGTKNSPTSNFNVGSLTKQFTAFSILQLASKNKLSLSDKLIKFFPDFNKRLGNIFTIQQLLTHSSGIIDHYAFVDTNVVRHATDKDVFNAVKNIDSTYFAPGTHYRYSNAAYCLLALIIEKLSGMSYPEYIRKNIFLPLSMNESQVFQVDAIISSRVLGYDTAQNGFKRLDAADAIFFSTEGDGGVYTSVTDYVKWFHALQNGTLLGKEWIAKARSPQFSVNTENELSYGYGWFVRMFASRPADETEVYHTGSNGGFRAISFTIPSKNYLIVILSNRTGVDLENIVQEINKILRMDGKSYTKIDGLESFNNSSPNFAPCKETT
jgi:D-alanyl-D-alanine carboxypeptidase